jgi:hypothetical protein
MDVRHGELIGLCLLAALGCGFALAHYDLLFAAIFALAMGIAFTAAMRRWP